MTWKLAVVVVTLTAATVSTQVQSTVKPMAPDKGLTQVAGIKVGHHTLTSGRRAARSSWWTARAPLEASRSAAPHLAPAKPICSIR